MSTHTEFLAEREKVDFLIQQGFRMNDIQETLDGERVTFEKENKDKQILTIQNADARKYISALLIQQMKTFSMREI